MLTLLLETIRDWVKSLLVTFHSTYLGYVTPQMFGAVGDGVHDDTLAIQQALDRGGVIYFPEGTYLVSNGHIIGTQVRNDLCMAVRRPNTHLKGEKGKSVIKVSDSIQRVCVVLTIGSDATTINNARYSSIDGLTFQGSETYGRAEYGIKLVDIVKNDDISITNCIFRNNMYSALSLRGCNRILCDNLLIEACDCGIVQQTQPCSDVIISNCHITGASSISDFVNYNSEPIGTMCYGDVGQIRQDGTVIEGTQGRCKRWTIRNVVIEHKHTNAISISGGGSTASFSDGRIIAEDWSISNVILRDVAGGIKLSNAQNIMIDNVMYNNSEDGTLTGANLLNVLAYSYTKNITTRNITTKVPLAWQLRVVHSQDCLFENFDLGDIYKFSSNGVLSLIGTVLQNLDNCIFRNILLGATTDDNRIQLDSVTNSYIDFALSPNAINTLSIVINNGNTNNTIVQRNTSAININRITSTSIADSNRYVYENDAVFDVDKIASFNQFKNPNVVNVLYTDDLKVASDRTSVKSFFLSNDGAEVTINFNISAGMTAKSMWFATGGNIIPISDEYIRMETPAVHTVVCHFKQNGDKWVETQRLKKYANGRIEDISHSDLVTRSEIEDCVQETDTIPTASADYVGKSYLYTGNTTSTYQKGGIYECQQTLTDTYEWKLVNVPVAVVKDIVANSADYAAFQSNIALL